MPPRRFLTVSRRRPWCMSTSNRHFAFIWIMSIYDEREKPACKNFRSQTKDSENPFILKWWTSAHDDLLRERIKKDQWIWYWSIREDILRITEKSVIEEWKRQDPLCSTRAWYNILVYFASSRAERLGLTRAIRASELKMCVLCRRHFLEDSLPVPLIKRMGMDNLEFCAPCASSALFNRGDMSASPTEIVTYLKKLARLLQRIPTQDFGGGVDDLTDLTTEERLTLFNLLLQKPSLYRVKQLYGSWLNALIEAGILENGARPTSRGTQCLANDGHVCFSLAEKTIDDFLYSRGIPHKREAKYPEGNFRADFSIRGIFIEYFGLMGNAEYELKAKLKRNLCEKHNVQLISIYPRDLLSLKKLEEKLNAVLIYQKNETK